MGLIDLWQQAQPAIRGRVGDSSYETWFSALHITALPPQTIVIETPDEFFKNWIIDNYQTIIIAGIKEISDENINITVTVNAALNKDRPQEQPYPKAKLSRPTVNVNINPRFSFNNFVIGPSNRFAYAACMAVAESPAKAYNPLFLYGRVGLGKTHLMQAITQKIKQTQPSAKCCYISSESFTNELIDAIRHRSTSNFRQKYRNIDVLLIDDIHFIAGKESTQEEFFHTFNSLHNTRKQIIISSDRPPKEIANLEERLSSRFAWGLITDIQPPDYETRVAILRKKSENEPVDIPDNVISFIAEQIKTNIRELEGALIRVVAYSLLEENTISLNMAKEVLKDLVKETVSTLNIETIQKHVASFFNITITELKAKRRSRNIIIPRQIAMYLSREMTNFSLPEIGAAFGGKDHTTVLHSFKKIAATLETDAKLKETVKKLSTGLK